MKKILSLICAVALVSGANAQVKQAKGTDEIPVQKAKALTSPLMMSASKGATKATTLDTLPSYSYVEALNQSSYIGYGATDLPLIYDENGEPFAYDWDAIGTLDAVFFNMGTGGLNYKYGGGELGYSLDFQVGNWFDYMAGETVSEKSIAGAMAYLGRAKSTYPGVNEMKMPLYFKHYSYPKGEVTKQKAYVDLSSNKRGQETIDVYYPWDRSKGTLSEKMEIPLTPDRDDPNDFEGKWFGARFSDPAVAGNWPCVSLIFPTERDLYDTMWNVTLWHPFVGSEQINITSMYEGAVYVVYDFNYQHIWFTDNTYTELVTERDGFIPDSAAQPDSRYAIVPQQTFVYTDRNGNPTTKSRNGEPLMMFILTDAVNIERGAAYDKYVEVKVNPAIDYTVIAATDAIKNVEIYNLNGKLVKTQACNSNVETISLSGLNSGMYIAKVTTTAGIANKKIMVR